MVNFKWYIEKGYGYLEPDHTFIYDKDYLQKFKDYEQDPKTDKLNELRREFVDVYIQGQFLLDYGCGACTFIKSRPNTYGFDLIPETIEQLKDLEKYFKPICCLPNICFWDSLEHIPDPSIILKHVLEYAFISTPIYKDVESVFTSKHYKPNEHLWYFTMRGLINYMKENNFIHIAYYDLESKIGRKSIGTFAFKRDL